jgi:hypothetical protein
MVPSSTGAGAYPVAASGDAVADADEGESQEALVGQQALGELEVVHLQVGQGVAPQLGLLVHERTRAQSLDETPELGGSERLPADVDEVDVEATLLEEPEGGAGRLGVGRAEDLDGRSGHRGEGTRDTEASLRDSPRRGGSGYHRPTGGGRR